MNYCIVCGKEISVGSTYCYSCSPRVRAYGVEGTKWLYKLVETNRDTSKEELFRFIALYYRPKSHKGNKIYDIVKSIRKMGYSGNIKDLGIDRENVSRGSIAKRARAILSDIDYCQICGREDCELICHHIVPVRLGGKSIKRNLIKLCKDCHRKVHKNISNILRAHFKNSFEFMLMLLRDTLKIQ
ncbi:MAG: HNH endonuclease signature motif containing protein [Pseudomonadota bacterium]|nr:HNH endonuclease signature motif containing protein [Pseudomonadota bacterium]